MRLSASSAPLGPGRGVRASAPLVAAAAWTPSLLASRLFDYSAEDAVLSSGKATSIPDTSGHGNTLTMTGLASTRPTASTCAALNGAVSLLFDGNDQGQTSGLVMPTADGTEYTLIVVVQPTDTIAATFLGACTSGGSRAAQGAAGPTVHHWKAGLSFSEDGASRATGMAIVIATKIGVSSADTMRINGAGVSITSSTNGVLTPAGALFLGSLGGASYTRGHICRAIGVLGTLSAGDQVLLDAWTLAKFGV